MAEGEAIELAGDELTVPRIAATVSAGTGRPLRYVRPPRALLRVMGKEARMLLWFGESGYRADIPALRALHPDLLTLEAWLERVARAPRLRPPAGGPSPARNQAAGG